MDYDEILKKIIRRYGAETENIRATQLVESRLERHTATYADAEKCAQEIGQALTEAFREYLPEALTDGKLFRAAAEVLVEQPMKHAGRDVAEIAEKIQRQMNENAGIGIKPVVPAMNQDQIDGIITGICNAESFADREETLYDQVENCLEGYVDDFVRENADFQYKAGLDPIVIRTATGKCCKWCSNLAGVYKYVDVSDRGNDVWRRHRNCHCVVEYDPGQKSRKRKVVSGDKRLLDGEKADRINTPEATESTRSEPVYHSKGDPMADAFGRGIDSNPEEIERFRKECQDMGVEIIEKGHEALEYQPSPVIGKPGQLIVSKDASYGGWCHEMNHVYDDRDNGWDGALRVWDKEDHIKREEKAYSIEIKMAEEAGRSDIAERLRENLEEERRRINESP